MEVTGLDRVVIMVRDIDKALEFFSQKLGMEFKELDKNISERDGVRSYVCHKTHVHLISPILPLPENAAPPMKKRVDLLKKNAAIFNALTFMVDDTAKVEAELKQQGITIQHRYEASPDYASIGMDNFREVVTSDEGTLGLVIGLAAYDRQHINHYSSTKGESSMKVTGLDRIVVMVRDMDKALAFFSGKLGMQFRELSKEIQERDGNRGFVCHETHLHLVQPRLPLPEGAAPFLKQGAELLKEKEAVVLVLLFKMDDPLAAAEEMKQQGFVILRTWEENHDYASVGMDNLVEFIVDPKDTLGIAMGFSKWDRI
jgi:catechol 2,3-dioxygenase-like lactoylglutathione lyase family enzyme